MPLHSINPATGETLRSFPAFTEEDLRARIALAAEAAETHRALSIEQRTLYLRRLALLLRDETVDLAQVITLETGKPARGSAVEVQRCIELCRYYADNAARLLAPELLSSDSNHAYVQWSPLGVVLAVMPWESPLWHAMRFAVPAIVAGNVVLLRMAVSVPQCVLALQALFRRAGFERGTLTALLIEDRQVELVLKDERVAAVTVNGSASDGRALAAQAGWLLKRSAMQIHSSGAMVVLPSADLTAAIAAAARALTGIDGSGAAARIVVHTTVYNDFAHTLVQAVEALRVGLPDKDDVEIGPLGTQEALVTLVEQVDAAITAGGRVLTGGAKLQGAKGNYFEPTVLSDVPRTSAVARDALHGPVAMLFRAHTLEEAIAIANDTPFGAAVSVWATEPGEQQTLSNSIDTGTVSLNTSPSFDPRLPVGGSKRSGNGRELGLAGMRECMQPKTVLIG